MTTCARSTARRCRPSTRRWKCGLFCDRRSESMKRTFLALLMTCCAVALGAAEERTPRPIIQSDQSFKNEVQRAIDRGLDWLKANQNTNGWWSTPDHPAITALPITAFKGDPSKRYADSPFV